MKYSIYFYSTVFDIYINGQYLPVLVFESNLATNEMAKLAMNATDVLLAYHGLRIYATAAVNKGQLPRYLKDGNQYFHHLMTKRRFLSGHLPLKYLQMDVDRTIFNEAISPLYDPTSQTDASVWKSNLAAHERAQSLKLISRRTRLQHTGVEMIYEAVDERSGYDLSRFTNMVDIMLWRTSLHPEENAFVSMSQGTTKPYSWRKFNNQIATLANYFSKKCMLKTGTRVMLMFHFGADFVRALYACFVVGLIPVICTPPELLQSSQKRIQEDVNTMMRTLYDLNIQHVIVNAQTEDILRNKTVTSAAKIATTIYGKLIGMKRIPDTINIEKAPRFNKLLGPESGYSVRSEWTTDKLRPAFVLVYQNQCIDFASGAHQYVSYSHGTIVSQCRSQKLTCQLKYQKPLIVTGLSAFEGLGLLYAAFCGVYVGKSFLHSSPEIQFTDSYFIIGCTTILMPTVEFKNNTLSYFELIAKNKCPTICANYLVFDYAMSRINPSEQRLIQLQNTHNIILAVSSRTKPKFYEKICRYLSLSRLERENINTVYSHPFNPMITTRSYMLLEPISLIADFEWLRQGIVRPLQSQSEDTAYGVLLQDSGMVPTNTMIAIVNPETHILCPSNVIGEIWVSSDSNAKGLYGTNRDHAATFEAVIPGADSRVKYMRTGDIGFLWNVQRKSVGTQASVEEGQCLYVLGHIDEIILSKGLIHFAIDIEGTVENCHQDILSEGW
jgi:acyl-CoA synthetase (AMP-forming)/AMP-acid ligase II